MLAVFDQLSMNCLLLSERREALDESLVRGEQIRVVGLNGDDTFEGTFVVRDGFLVILAPKVDIS